MRIIVAIFTFLIFATAIPVSAQEIFEDLQGVWRAEVLEISDEQRILVPGTDVENAVQTITAILIEGERRGEKVTFLNDFTQLEEGDRFYLNYLVTIEGDEFFSVREVDRSAPMFALIGLFAFVVIVFGGMQGVRSLLSLAGSLLVIVYVLVPTLVSGFSPVPVSIGVAGLVLFFAIFFTHGFNKRSLVAYGGTMTAVLISGVLALLAIQWTSLTGISNEESLYLNLSTGGQLDFVGLLLAGIIIGALGVLDDIAVTQVAVVRELFIANKDFTKWDVYHKAVRVGREHVGALVNTLVLAYAGTALPLLLLFSLSDGSAITIINREIFAAEIVRALVGSIGLVLTVPITTLLAAFVLNKYRETLAEDGGAHSHSHHH